MCSKGVRSEEVRQRIEGKRLTLGDLLNSTVLMAWKALYLDVILVPLGVLMMILYNLRLMYKIRSASELTVVGINRMMRRSWVKAIMQDPKGNGVLAVQTIRNTIMGSTLLASTAITVSSVIGTLAAGRSNSSEFSTSLIVGSHDPKVLTVKYISIVICFLVAFFCHVQSIRYFSHVSFLVTTPTGDSAPGLTCEYVYRLILRGTNFFTLGMRAYYFTFPLLLWLFGPIPHFATSLVMVSVLSVIDTPQKFNVSLPSDEEEDVEAHGSNESPKPSDD